ncbi:hypothetical protein CLOM_g24416 [Closterium sp. NIES-68]|nr:hypothetical protein CLOM_g24416 [Closterium sp. NIES-68]GJP60832.1 hypothetical protein CLOP_g18049 [Closterium sp. NIES-67]
MQLASTSTLGLNCQAGFERPGIITVLASILDRVVAVSEQAPPRLCGKTGQQLTVFHGLRAPGISIAKYLDRIFKYANCSPSCFVIAYIYIDRLIKSQPDMVITSLNVHRLLATSVMIAAKFLDDEYYNNAYYAKVGGVATSEMNRLELEFLFRIKFRLNVTTEEFMEYCKLLENELWTLCQAPQEMQYVMATMAAQEVQIQQYAYGDYVNAAAMNKVLTSSGDAVQTPEQRAELRRYASPQDICLVAAS